MSSAYQSLPELMFISGKAFVLFAAGNIAHARLLWEVSPPALEFESDPKGSATV